MSIEANEGSQYSDIVLGCCGVKIALSTTAMEEMVLDSAGKLNRVVWCERCLKNRIFLILRTGLVTKVMYEDGGFN